MTLLQEMELSRDFAKVIVTHCCFKNFLELCLISFKIEFIVISVNSYFCETSSLSLVGCISHSIVSRCQLL